MVEKEKMFLNTRYTFDLFLGYTLYFAEHGIFLECSGNYVKVAGSMLPWIKYYLNEVSKFICGWCYRKTVEVKLSFPLACDRILWEKVSKGSLRSKEVMCISLLFSARPVISSYKIIKLFNHAFGESMVTIPDYFAVHKSENGFQD